MLKLDKDEFITQFVTIFLATEMASNNRGSVTPEDQWKRPPVDDALRAARMAWMHLLELGRVTPWEKS